MARAMYKDVATDIIVDAGGNSLLAVLSNVQVAAYVGGTYGTPSQTAATIYQAATGAAQGPSPGAAASGGPNPFTTGTSGSIEFFLDPGKYDIVYTDTQAPARFAEKVTSFDSVPGDAGGIPSALIAGDGSLDLAALGAAVMRQVVPIGTVLDWWRPANTVAVPAGFEIADGHLVLAANHDFGTGADINVPDLRNKFKLGANIANPDAAQGSLADTAAAAPGIRGSGGSHTQTVPAHYHGVGSLAASGGSHSHTITDPGHLHNVHTALNSASSFRTGLQFASSTGNFVDTNVENWDDTAGTGISVPSSGTHSHSFSGSVGLTAGVSGDNPITSDGRPGYVGLLQIIKVKHA
jgi:hypothetical protein